MTTCHQKTSLGWPVAGSCEQEVVPSGPEDTGTVMCAPKGFFSFGPVWLPGWVAMHCGYAAACLSPENETENSRPAKTVATLCQLNMTGSFLTVFGLTLCSAPGRNYGVASVMFPNRFIVRSVSRASS